jgi:menaquinone-dependent protoporphyrinogen oxidase
MPDRSREDTDPRVGVSRAPCQVSPGFGCDRHWRYCAMPKHIGLYFASHHGQTRAIAAAIGQRLTNYGCDVTITDLEGDPRTRPGLHECDTVLIGAPLYIRRYPSAVTRFIRAHLTDLRRHPSTGFFSVSLTAALGTPEAYIESLGPLRELLSDIDWTPDWIASFGGALAYRQYDPLTRWVLRRIAAHYHHSTDTTRDHDLTSWPTVELFADHVFQNAAPSQFRSGSLSEPSRTLDRVMPAFDKGQFSLSPMHDDAAFLSFNEPGHEKIVGTVV